MPGRHSRIQGRPFAVYLAAILALALSISFASTASAQNVNVSGSTGADGTYPTLAAAFTAINAGSQAGNNIQVNIVASTAEGATTATLNNQGWNTLTVNPVGSVSVSGATTSPNPLIDLNGATNVTINGLNTGGNALSIVNTTVGSGSTIRFINDASNNTVTNCTIAGAETSTTSGTIVFSTAVTTGNFSNTISNNNITSLGGLPATNAIYSLGTAGKNNVNTITGNNISDFFNATLVSTGINIAATGNTAWMITNNKLFQTANRTFTTANTHSGIFIGTGDTYTITGNTIGFADANGNGTTNYLGITSGALTGTFPSSYGLGTAVLNATRYIGINCNFTAGATASSIQNNTIAGFALLTSSGATTANGEWCAINVTSGNANIGTTTGNTIGATSGLGSIYKATSVSGGVAVGIYATSANTINIQNNTIGALDSVGTTATTAGAFNGIDTAGAGVFTITGNTIGNTTADNIRTGYTLSGANLSNAGTLTSTTGSGTSVFIRNAATGATSNLSTNTLRGFATSSTVQTVTGITNTGAVTTTISMNSNLLGTAGLGWVRYAFANSGTLTGIFDSGAGAGAALNINSNDIRGITYSALSTGANTYINCTAVPLSFTANLNTFTNLNVNTSGTVTFILMTYTQATSTGTKTVTNNSIVTAFNRGGASGSTLLVSDNGSSVTGVLTTVQNNTFSNMTVAGTSTITGLNLTDGGTAPTKNITGNTLNNWTAVTGAINAVNITYWNGASSLSNNTITNLTGQSTVTGITLGSSANTANPLNVSSNTINNLTSTGTGGAVTGITCSNSSPVINITGNAISTLASTGASQVAGVIVSAAGSTSTGTTVSKNKICDLSGTNASTTVFGILVSSSSTSGPVILANNLIGNLTASIATNSNGIIGINITGSATTAARNVYYNTVYLNNTTSGAGFGSSGISTLASATSTTSTLDLRNNVIVNTSVQNGAGLTVAYRRSVGTAGTLANYASTSNNNDFYAGTPSATNLIYSDGTSTAQTITAYKNGVFTAGTIAPRDSASFTENPPFLSTTCANATFLHINTGTPTQLESGGTPVAGVTTDFDGDTRNGSTPDVGADEFNGIAADFTAPTISYAALQRDLVAASRSFANVTVTDGSGVNTTAGTRPRVYYKKSTNANTFNDNTNATDGWKYAEAAGAAGSPFSFTIDYSLLFGGGGVSVGDNIQYFVVAQDLATTPNVGINSGTFAATPSSVNLTAAAFPITGTINSYNIVNPISGTFNVGTGGDYGTLTAAATDINNKILTGPVVLNLTDSSYTTSPQGRPDATGETFPITINPNPGSSATNTITIKPATGVTAAITAPTTAVAVFRIDGASYVTIDGSNSGGTDRSLTINNPNSTVNGVGAILVLSKGTGAGATFDTIKNCVIKAGTVGTTSIFTFGIFVGDTSGAAAGADNDNLTIQNNVISLCRTGIQAVGTAAGIDDNMTISGNTIGDNVLANSLGRNGLVLSVINNANVSGNTVKNIFIASDTANPIGISAGTMTNSTISQNLVTGIQTTSILAAGIAFSTASSANTITQNTVDGVSSISSTDPIGISIGTGFVSSTISRNIIKNIFTTTTGGYGGRGFVINTGTATSALTFSNNFISNIQGDGWSAFSSDSIAGVLITGTTGGLNFYYNSINLGSGTFAGNTSGTLSAAFYVASTVTNLDLRDNIFVTNLVNSNAAAAKTYAIYSDAASSAFTTMNNNDYFVSGTQGVLGFIAATDRTTLAAIQAGFGQNGASVNGNPQFMSATDLHINPSIATVVEGTATPIAGITIDIDGDTRNATTPDIGADEGDFTPVLNNDMQATMFVDPVNGGSKLANTAFSPQASFTNNGLNTQTNVTVRYRICADGACNTELYNNTQVIASITSGTTTTVTFASVAGGLSAGTYTIKAKSELGGDQVPANDEITGSFTVQNPLSGNYTVGTGGNYQTITAAANALNNLGVTGPVTMTLTDSSYMRPDAETYPIVINAIPGASATNTVTIKPANPNTTITGSSTSALFVLNGTSYVTIDGSSNGTSSRDLTITNNNASGAAVIWLKSNGTGLGATSNTIKNVNIVGGSVTATYGIALSGATIGTAGADNDNNTLQNNSITTVFYGIYANGTAATSAGGLDGLSITNNVIGPAASGATNTGFAGIYVGNAVSPVVTGNTIRNLTTSSGSTGGIYLVSNVNGGTVSLNVLTNIVSSASTSGTASITGIYLGTSVINTLVSQNSLSGIVNNSTGGWGVRAIMVNTGTNTSNDMLADNMVTDVWNFQDSSNVYWPIGIAIEASTGGVKVYFNSVNLFGQHTGYSSNTTGGGAPALFINTSVTGLDVRDNVFTSSYENTTSTGDKSYGIFCASANTAFTTINYNDYYATSPTSGSTPILGSLNGTDYTTIAAWMTATGQDAQSISAYPGYVSNTNLHLATSPIPPVSRAGVTIAGITIDIDGDTRQSPPDMGADEITTYILTYTAGANGSISGTTPQEVISGGSGTAVTAVANTCYHFVNWSDGSTQNPRTDTNVVADLSVTANFAINTYTLTYTAGPNGSISGTSPQTVNCGSSGTAVTAVPNACYHFVNWSDGSTANPRTDTNVQMDINVTANFAVNTYTLTYTAGPNGSISGTSPQTVNCGADGTAVTAVPNACYHFVNWSDGSTQNPRTDTNVQMDINVTANFAINTYTLTYAAGPHGSISGTSPQTVNCGGSGSPVTAVPDPGYAFHNWSDASTANPRTDTNVTTDINVTANFVSTNANLANLVLSQGTLQPAFDPDILNYTAAERHTTTSITVTPTVQDANATITVNGQPVPSGQQSQPISLNVGNNTITVVVYAQDEGGHPNAPMTTKTYTIFANRANVPVVTNTNNSGAGSLRDALDDVFDGETITFNIAAGRPNVAHVITLTSGELVVNNSVTISGPGANMLTVMRDPNASAFRIYHIVSGKTVTISGMTISGGNSGNANGGGILNDHATLAVASCTLDGNVNALGYGGGIYNDGSSGAANLTITNSTLSGNASPSGSGGGIFNEGSNGIAYLTINNSTLSGNSSSPGTGGAIVNKGASGTATLTIANSTLAGNSADAPQGGGIWNQSASLTLGNTILKKGSTGANIANSGGTVTSAGYNLSDDNGAGFLSNTGDQINTDPMLGPLKDNGGTTLTHAPLIGSPAIDQGKRDTIPTLATNVDQRGFVRPVDDPAVANAVGGDTSDIGAIELAVGVHPTSAVSRKTHTGVGDFNVDLPMVNFANSPLGIECRAGGATGVYKLIFFFSEPVSFSSAAVTSGAGSVDSTSGLGTSQVTINLIGVTDVQTITVGLFDVDNGTNSGDVGTRMGVLIGDVNANRSVNAADVSLVKSNSGSGVSQANFRSDVNANGAISAADVSLVKSKSGNGLP